MRLPKNCQDCQFRAGKYDLYGCNYATLTGHTRLAAPPGAGCPYKVKGPRLERMVELEEVTVIKKDHRQKIDDRKAMRLYLEGKNDVEMGEILHVGKQSVLNWRKKRGLKSKYEPKKRRNRNDLRGNHGEAGQGRKGRGAADTGAGQ